MRFIKFFLSFEVFFVLWLFSYQYKNAFELLKTYDISILLTFLVVPWGAIIYVSNKSKALKIFDPAVGAFLVLTVWFVVSSFLSPSQFYKTQKILCFGFYTIPTFLIGYGVFAQEDRRVERLMRVFFIFSMVIVGECFHVFFKNGIKTLPDILGTNYLTTGQTLGVGTLVLATGSLFCFFGALSNQKGKCNQEDKRIQGIVWGSVLIPIMCSCLFVYALINLGARGPVLACSIGLVVLYAGLGFFRSFSKSMIHLGVFLVFFAIFYSLLNDFFHQTGAHFFKRLTPVLDPSAIDGSLHERFAYYQSAFRAFLENPLMGLGLGAWPLFHGLGDISLHPHNIFLEVAAETGIIGVLLFLSLLFVCLKKVKFSYFFSKFHLTSVLLITLFSFLNALKTGDLHDNILFFFFLSLCAGISQKSKTSLVTG